jgi:PilZ domain-containing protein
MEFEADDSTASSPASQIPTISRYSRYRNGPINEPGSGVDMFVNRRKSERRLCRSLAKIQFGTGTLPRDCMITDISEGGVKVIAEYPEIPAEFTITLSTGRPRQCRLAWRIGCEFGAQFVD